MAEIADFPRSTSLGEAALKAMLEHRVSPTPQNYTIWYAYLSGLWPEITRTIDALIANKHEFTDALSTELFNRFFDATRHFGLLQETSGQFEVAVQKVLKHIASAAGDAKTFGKTLDSYSSELDGGLTTERVRGIVANLLTETQRVAEQNRARGALEPLLGRDRETPGEPGSGAARGAHGPADRDSQPQVLRHQAAGSRARRGG